MNELFKYFLDNYLDGEQFDNKDKGYHKVLMNTLPNYLYSFINSEKYLIKGSCGASNKAEVPWLGFFDRSITTSAQYGIYVIYLFCADMSGFYLCLGQGITNFEKFENKDVVMYNVANYFKDMIDSNFSKDEIDLKSRTSNGKNYAKVNILNKYYSKDNINSCNFEKDLMEMMNIYSDISETMGTQNYDSIIDNVISNIDPNYIVEKEAEELIEKTLLEEGGFESNDTVVLKEIQIPKGRQKTNYSKITEKTVKKVDYVKKQKTSAKNGLLGERLVMEYEREKLISGGREDLAQRIRWVSKEDDGTGYDIISYDLKGNEMYIEVKTTEGKDDSIFFISINEVNVMEELKDKYYIYRVSNVKSNEPKFYILNYNDFKIRIKLIVETYSALLVGE